MTLQNILNVPDENLEFWVDRIRADLIYDHYAIEIQHSTSISDEKIQEKNMR